jgi:hypothetical protein
MLTNNQNRQPSERRVGADADSIRLQMRSQESVSNGVTFAVTVAAFDPKPIGQLTEHQVAGQIFGGRPTK